MTLPIAFRVRRVARWGLACLLVACLAGCFSVPPVLTDEVNRGPFYTPKNFFSVKGLPSAVGRVVLLPVADGKLASEEITALLDEALVASLLRSQRFAVTTLSRVECRSLWGRTQFPLTEALPHGFLEDLKGRARADAVLMVELTGLKLYQPQSLGFRAMLVSCSDGGVFWSFDEVLSAGEAAVRNSARREYFQQEQGNRPYDFSLAGLQSPSWFAGFVARQMFSTLPPR